MRWHRNAPRRVDVARGAARAARGGGSGGGAPFAARPPTLRFWLELPDGASDGGDVAVPAGRLFFGVPCWDAEWLGDDARVRARREADAAPLADAQARLGERRAVGRG